MFRLQAWLEEYKQVNDKIAMKFYVLDDENKPIYAFALCDRKMIIEFSECISFRDELYKEELDFDNIIKQKHLIGVEVEINSKGNLIVIGFFKIPTSLLYDDCIEKGILSKEEKVLEEIKKIKLRNNKDSNQTSLFG